MTDPSTDLPSVPAPKKKNRFMWKLLGIALLASAGSVAIVHCPWLRPLTVEDHTQNTTQIAALEQRVEALETRLNAPSEPQVSAAPASVNEAAPLAETVKTLEAQIAQLEGRDQNSQQAAQKLVASAFAFWDLRDAAKTGHPFAVQLGVLRATTGNDAAVSEQLVKLEPFAANIPPTLPQLREQLSTAETLITAAVTPEETPDWWARLKALLQPLISVHTRHNPEFDALEKSLDSGDAQAALDAFKALPPDAQKALADWQTQLEARATVDAALQTLTAHFTGSAS